MNIDSADQAVLSDSSIAGTAETKGLRRNYLSLFDVIAQAIGVIAPSVMPVLALPSEFGMAGYGSWLSYLIATREFVDIQRYQDQRDRRDQIA